MYVRDNRRPFTHYLYPRNGLLAGYPVSRWACPYVQRFPAWPEGALPIRIVKKEWKRSGLFPVAVIPVKHSVFVVLLAHTLRQVVIIIGDPVIFPDGPEDIGRREFIDLPILGYLSGHGENQSGTPA